MTPEDSNTKSYIVPEKNWINRRKAGFNISSKHNEVIEIAVPLENVRKILNTDRLVTTINYFEIEENSSGNEKTDSAAFQKVIPSLYYQLNKKAGE